MRELKDWQQQTKRNNSTLTAPYFQPSTPPKQFHQSSIPPRHQHHTLSRFHRNPRFHDGHGSYFHTNFDSEFQHHPEQFQFQEYPRNDDWRTHISDSRWQPPRVDLCPVTSHISTPTLVTTLTALITMGTISPAELKKLRRCGSFDLSGPIIY
jgi:hypothetical protein